ncbi:aminoacyl-tRNA hydrolase [Candidatus Dependentiae bacterium]|nr:aminoacyl-tRNA hydrolase [Candidatus Dependentiae bacterium]
MNKDNYSIKNIKAIIGLGNPGLKYYRNRHNIGFRILDKISQDYNVNWSASDVMEHSKIAFSIDNVLQQIILIKPQTFMNDSGRVMSYLNKKGIRSENILVVHDELEKSFGKIIIKFGGSARGHNGLRSIINAIGYDFWRLKFGIGRPEDKKDVANYVLSNFNSEEEKEIDILIENSVNKIFQR